MCPNFANRREKVHQMLAMEHDQTVPDDRETAWYVIHTRNRHEAKVCLGLEARGLEVFFPRATVPSRRRDRFQYMEVPLFSCYLFVHSRLNLQAYHDIIKLQGVLRILGNRGVFNAVPDETIASIQAILSSGHTFYPWPRLIPGQRVRVISGPLFGAMGTIWRYKPGKRRLVVGVDLLGRSIAVDLEKEAVEPYS